MDRPIAVGDLVIITRPTPCCGAHSIFGGIPSRVTAIYKEPSQCFYCGEILRRSIAYLSIGKGCYPLSQLTRIDPDILRDDVPTKEERHV